MPALQKSAGRRGCQEKTEQRASGRPTTMRGVVVATRIGAIIGLGDRLPT
jgi:hypothetical protein